MEHLADNLKKQKSLTGGVMNIYSWAEMQIYGNSTAGPRKLCLHNTFSCHPPKKPRE